MKKLLVLFSALTFSAAAASAQTTAPAHAQHRTERANKPHKTPEQHAEQAAKHMAKQLNLTAAQTEQVRQLQLSRYQEMQQFRAQHATADNKKGTHTDMKAHQAQYDARLKQILKPDQYTTYAQLRAERMAKHKEHKGNRKASS